MNWIAFLILGYIALGLQTGLGAFVRLGSEDSTWAEPNLGLIVLVFITLSAPRKVALLAAFTLGAMQDLATRQPLGLFAFSYGAAAIMMTWAAQAVYREHPLTHFSFAVLGGTVTSAVVIVHGKLAHSPHTHQTATLMASMIYTAILTPLVVGFLQRFKRVFAFRK